MTTFRHTVDADLAARIDELERLRSLFRRLSTVPLSLSAWKAPNMISGDADRNARTQALFASLTMAFGTTASTTGLPVADGRITVEAEMLEDGGVQLHRPEP